MPLHALYLHGYASGPESSKGRAFETHFGERGLRVTRLNLRVPSFEHLRLSAMIAHVREAIGGPDDRAVVIGSSLGGICAARVAEADSRVAAAILLAPAFRLAEQWEARMDPTAFAEWKRTGWTDQEDYAEQRMRRVDFAFLQDAAQVESTGDGWPNVRAPTIIFHGRNDEVVDINLSRHFAKIRSHVRLVELDDGHDLAVSVPTILARSEEFLRELQFQLVTD